MNCRTFLIEDYWYTFWKSSRTCWLFLFGESWNKFLTKDIYVSFLLRRLENELFDWMIANFLRFLYRSSRLTQVFLPIFIDLTLFLPRKGYIFGFSMIFTGNPLFMMIYENRIFQLERLWSFLPGWRRPMEFLPIAIPRLFGQQSLFRRS